MSDLYKIVNGKRVRLTASQKAKREAEELANQPTIEDKRKDLKNKLYLDMSKTTVEINGKVFWADPESEQNFSGRIREMELNSRTETKWAQGQDVFIATLEELKYVYAEGTKKNAALWDVYISELEKLQQ